MKMLIAVGLLFAAGTAQTAETPEAATLATHASPHFLGNWIAENCVDVSPDRLPQERLTAEAEMIARTGTLSIGANFFDTARDMAPATGEVYVARRVSKQIYSMRNGQGNKVVVVMLYQRLAPAGTDVPFISSSIRDYELRADGKLVERRRGFTYQLTTGPNTELTSGIYDAYCTFRRS